MASAQRRRPPVTITARDRVLLGFAAEHRFVTAAQLAFLLATAPGAIERRLRVLTGAGMMRHERPLEGCPSLYAVTRAALRAIGSDLGPPRPVNLSLHRHDHALGWLMLYALDGRLGPIHSVTGERRMRSEDRRAPPGRGAHGVRTGGFGPRGEPSRHYPDMFVVTATGHRVAFELERTTKERQRLESIVATYAADRGIHAVVYLVARASTGRAVQRASVRLGVERLVSVRRFDVPELDSGAAVRAARTRTAAAARERSP